MEAFSLLKYWKSSAAARGGLPTFPAVSTPATTTILAAGDFDSDEDAADDEGPFIDLEFAVPEEEGGRFEEDSVEFGEIVDDSDVDDDVDHHDVDDVDHDDGEEEDDDDDDGEDDDDDGGGVGEDESADSNVGGVSPSDEVLFNGQIVRISGDDDEEITSKSGQIPIPASFLRSATKFRVLMLKLKRSKSDQKSNSQTQKQTPKHNNNRKLFTVKFKVEEVPVISLLSRASSNSKSTTTAAAATTTTTSGEAPSPDSGDEKRNKKEVIQKYLKLVKPLYIRVSKRHHPTAAPATATEEAAAEKREVKAANPPPPPTTTCSVSSAFTGSGQKVSSVVGLNLKGMIMAKKHLGKSKSAIVHSNSSSMQKNGSSNRRDDSLLEQQDGIQGAILHCKRSFNSSTQDSDSENKEDSSVLTRSASDPSHEKKRTTVKEEKNDVVPFA